MMIVSPLVQTVTPASLNRLVASCADDSSIIGICGENQAREWRKALGGLWSKFTNTISLIIFLKPLNPSLDLWLVFQDVSRSIVCVQRIKGDPLLFRIGSLTSMLSQMWIRCTRRICFHWERIDFWRRVDEAFSDVQDQVLSWCCCTYDGTWELESVIFAEEEMD